MIGPNPPAPNGPRKRKTSKAAKPAKASKSSKIPKEGKIMKTLVTPDDMERVKEMLRDKMLLDWLDQCAGEINLKNGKIRLHFGGKNGSARSVLTTAALSLRHLVYETDSKSK